jgi:hypothetical protein
MGESMKNNNTDLQGDRVGSSVVCVQKSNIKNYEKPVLISYGDVRDVTLGPTLGGGESGNAQSRCDRGNVPDNCIT